LLEHLHNNTATVFGEHYALTDIRSPTQRHCIKEPASVAEHIPVTMHFLTVIVFVFTVVAGGSALLQKMEDYSIELGMTAEYPAESCKEIYNKNPVGHSQSGYYWIKSCEKPMRVT